MIPLSASSLLKYTDPEHGTVLGFGYLTGERQEEYMALITEASKNYREAAWIAKHAEGKTDEQIDADIECMERSEALQLKLLQWHRRLVDLFLVEINGQPADGQPSDLFGISAIYEISAIIQERLLELSGQKIDGALKNSSRRRTSRSKTSSSTGATDVQRKAGNDGVA
jgi:hypothetical protein